MTEETIAIADESAMLAFGALLAGKLRAGDVIALYGGLGAGKTTLARGVMAALGFTDEVPSPSFAIVQPYDPPSVSLPVAHVDLYRLDGPEDALELALDEYLEDGALIIEWPERLGEALWGHALRLHIATGPDGARRLTAIVPDAWKDRWSPS